MRLRLLTPLLGALAASAIALAPSGAHAWPNAPDEDPRLAPPNDPGYGGQWNLWSYVPEAWTDTPGFRTEEIALGTGIHADRAWQVTTGDRRVIVAVLDSGAYWDNEDLVAKYYLNAGELAGCKPEPLDDPPPGATDFDVDGSGWFDIRDYLARYWPADPGDATLIAQHRQADDAFLAAHPDWDVNGNGMFEPQDLILKCSDGVDDDGNGYTDDVSGWDFFHDDNDAYDDNRFGHGNGEARDSVAEGNNGAGDIGVCPDCTALMVRVGDSFVADANDFGHGVIFGVDSGASVIQEALGSVNNTPFSKQAIDYAYDNNVVVIASAADELSYHHNFPGTNNHTVYVHAIQYDKASADQSTTFLNFNNCTNFGMQLLLSTPGLGCSSEATGITSGHAGLVYAAGLKANLDPPLSAEELKQILIMNVDDIDVNPLDDDPTKFPSGPGWDWHFGYGRNNARMTVDAVMEGRIPPEVDILTPSWFEVLYPDKTPTVDVTGRINVRRDGKPARYDEVTWVLEYALGVAPNDGFVEIAKGTTEGVEGTLASWDLTEIALDLDRKLEDPHQNAVTLRLRATGKLADGTAVTAEHRKGFLLERDPTLLPGFPIDLGGSGEASPVFANLDGDDDEELVVALADGTIHAFNADGSEAPGFPVKVDVRRSVSPSNATNVRNSCAFRTDKTGCIAQVGTVDVEVGQTLMFGPAVGDLDGDGTLEIVSATIDGWVYVYGNDGVLKEGWPQAIDWSLNTNKGKNFVTDSGFMAAPVLVDLDGQPGLEILVAAMDQHLYVWHANGEPMAPYPVRVGSKPAAELGDRIVCTPAVGDVDGDGDVEIAVGTSEAFGASDAQNEARVYLLDGKTGQILPGWPQPIYGLMVNVLPIVGRGVVSSPIMADLDYDGDLEISFDTISTQGWFFNHDGSIWKKMDNANYGAKSDSTDSPAYILMNNGAIGYIDPDGGLDFVKGTAGFNFALAFAGGGERGEFDHHLSGWDTDTGKMMVGFPRKHDDWQFFNTPTIVDIDNDRDPEVIVGSGGYLVRAWNYEGTEPEGWPKQTGGWIIASVAVGELDGDGKFEAAVTTRDGWLFAWNTEGETGSIFEWNGFGHDPHNTNNYETSPTPYKTWTGGGTKPQPDPEPDAGGQPDAGPTDDVGDDTTGPAETVGGDTAPEPKPKPKGGGCEGGDATPVAWLAALSLLALARRRRARA